jgi:hypothetical protein
MWLIQWEILVNRWNSKLINVNLFLFLTGVVSYWNEISLTRLIEQFVLVSHLPGGWKNVGSISRSTVVFSSPSRLYCICVPLNVLSYIPGFNCPEREANHSIQSTSVSTSTWFYISFRFSNVILDAAVQSSPFRRSCNFTLTTAVDDRLAEQWRTWQWPVLSHFQRNMNGVMITVNSHLGDPKSVSWNDLEISVHKSQM